MQQKEYQKNLGRNLIENEKVVKLKNMGASVLKVTKIYTGVDKRETLIWLLYL